MKKPKFKVHDDKRFFMKARKTFQLHEKKAKTRKITYIKTQTRVMWLKNELAELGERVLSCYPRWAGLRAQAQKLLDKNFRPS